jgi:hypothetical protein
MSFNDKIGIAIIRFGTKVNFFKKMQRAIFFIIRRFKLSGVSFNVD